MKRYARVLDYVVTEVIEIVEEMDIANLTPPGYDWVPAGPGVVDGWRYERGEFFPPPLEPVDLASVMAAKWFAVQAYMDSKARTMGYESLLIAVSYADESAVPRFQIEARKLRAWRSLVREKFGQISDLVVSRTRDVPSDDSLFVELPSFE
ncbi:MULTISPECIES: hypothetical protein [Achromobacter]|uniref:Uncharacterized protein n=1 Tax=Achromobacter spanius TaxID=217203 RepID=A0ABY8GZM4_9BURK|nr:MULTISPECIES: hypothetical protein [Achromobacter]WAI85849.1 hypothetical protein N8Z00_12570 [Achromobacter spanius]WEX95930.1 hypothetical protein N3Z32_07160 [Achromobacter sp. SS2-2022]WFP10350.1 hypothetical protein P8T11_10925 [Achromobacter spanius]